MQTFLPYPKFSESARVLDRQRLGKQRVETLQIMSALINDTGWFNHPAAKMWRGYEWALLLYQEACVKEWRSRGYSDTCLRKTCNIFFDVPRLRNERNIVPRWLGDKKFHLSHQSNLVRKDPEYYGPLFPGIKGNLPYIWPTND